MLPIILAATIAAAPSPTKTQRLAAYILKINPRATHAHKLAAAILAESKRFRLDPALFAAIAHTESHYRTTAKGKWYERGIWQLWPWARWHQASWDSLRQSRHGLPGYPDGDWQTLGRKLQVRASLDIGISTYLAAHLLAGLLRGCRRHTPYCYARYNRPAKPRRGYQWALRRRARAIRGALSATP